MQRVPSLRQFLYKMEGAGNPLLPFYIIDHFTHSKRV